MAYNTVSIKKDVDGKPIPQLYNPITNEYEVLQGQNGASRNILYDTDGNPVDIEGLITTIINILNAKNLPTGASTSAKQDEIIGYLQGLGFLIQAISETAGIKKIVDPLPAGDNNIGNVDVVSSARPTGASTAAKQDVIINAVDGLEALLTAIKDTAGIKKITDALPAGTNNIGKVTIDGSTMEYYGKSTDTKPTDIKVGATFFEIDTKEVYIFDGESWVVI